MAESFEFVLDEEQPMPTKEQLREVHARLVRWAFAGDVVEVVRCEDCEHSTEDGFCKLDVGLAVIHPKSYCSYGKRRADDAAD